MAPRVKERLLDRRLASFQTLCAIQSEALRSLVEDFQLLMFAGLAIKPHESSEYILLMIGLVKFVLLD